MRDILLPHLNSGHEENFTRNILIKETENPKYFRPQASTMTGFDIRSIKGHRTSHLFGLGTPTAPLNIKSNLLKIKSHVDYFKGYSITESHDQIFYYRPPMANFIFSPFYRPNVESDLSESGMIVIVSLREIPRDYAKIEIIEYIRQAGGRKVYISELAEELRLDFDLITDIMEELQAERDKTLI